MPDSPAQGGHSRYMPYSAWLLCAILLAIQPLGAENLAAAPSGQEQVPASPLDKHYSEIAERQRSIDEERAAYRQEAEEMEWDVLLEKLTTERLSPSFTLSAALSLGAAAGFTETLSALSRDPRVARIIEIAKQGPREERDGIYQEVDRLLNEWTKNLRTEAWGTMELMGLPAGTQLYPYLLHLTSRSPLRTAQTLYHYLQEQQRVFAVLRENLGGSHSLANFQSNYTGNTVSEITLTMLRREMRRMAAQRETLFPDNAEARDLLEHFLRYLTAVSIGQRALIDEVVAELPTGNGHHQPEDADDDQPPHQDAVPSEGQTNPLHGLIKQEAVMEYFRMLQNVL